MSDTAVARGALDSAAAVDGPGLRVAPRPAAAVVNLRGRLEDAGFAEAVAGVLGTAPPAEPNTVASEGQIDLFWSGPDEWLAVVWQGDPGELARRLAEALAGRHTAVTDVTAGNAVLDLAGPGARALLARGCPLDLHPRVFPVGRCAQSVLGHASVLLHLRDPEPAFTLLVRRSMAGYLWRWLEVVAGRLPGTGWE